MINYFIYAKDFSGSTQLVPYYHINGLKTIDEFKNDVDKIKTELTKAGEPTDNCKIIYLHWGDACFEAGEGETIKTYKEFLGGNMGTEPGTIIDWIKHNCISEEEYKIKLLYIITDGQIDHGSTEYCFKLNQGMQYETVVFHAFNEYLTDIDLSVAASFFKRRCLTYCNYELYDDIDIGEEFDYDKITVDNFQVEKDNLKSYIRLKFINTDKHDAVALQAIEKLKKLRKRLFAELSAKTTKPDGNLDTKDKNAFIVEFKNTNWFRNLNTPVYDTKVDIEKSISTLINYIVNEKKSFSFDALKFDTEFQNTVSEEVIVDVDFAPEQEIEFPDIILDDDKGIPVIILTQFNLLDKIIFHKTKESGQVSPASFNKFKSAMECPLFLVNDLDISESIGYFYTLNVFKQFLENSHKTEPRTRRPFHGGLVLTDTHHFDKYNDYILSATYFDSKKINYNIGLFYYVLWKNCENKVWMDKNVVEQLKQYVMRRISETVCKIGLSSLPLDPQQDTSLLTALWYCVELSSLIFKHDPLHYTHERLRMYYGVAHCMIEILKHFNYDLDLETIEKRRDLLRHVMSLKRIPTPAEKAYFVLEKIFKNVNGFLVSEIDKPFNINKLNYLKLNHKDMLCDDIVEESVNLSDYAHFMHFVGNIAEREASIHTVQKVCDKTFRPCFTIDRNKSFYTELAKVTKKIVINSDDKNNIILTFDAMDSLEFNRILSLYNLFIDFVINSQKYPTLSEYIEFISMKKKFRGNLVTIFPSNVYNSAVDVFEKYQDIITKVDVNRFIEVCKRNVNRIDRIKTEEVVKFNDDTEIIKFISSEEAKVNLKKTSETK